MRMTYVIQSRMFNVCVHHFPLASSQLAFVHIFVLPPMYLVCTIRTQGITSFLALPLSVCQIFVGGLGVEQVLFADETCDGTAQNEMGECRMDIIDSTLAYLGYDDTEAYGITWKVGGSLSVAAAAVFVALYTSNLFGRR